MNHCLSCGRGFEGSFCPDCGAAAEGAIMCPKCGAIFQGVVCPECGAVMDDACKCSKCGQVYKGNFCPNCGTPNGGPTKCPKCGAEVTGNFCSNCGYSVRGVKSAAAETQRSSVVLSKITGSAAFVFVKKHWALLLVAVLLLVAFLTLMITLVGLRGIYVNVNNPDDYYDFDATSYRASTIDFLTDKDTLEEGTWKLSGNKLTLTINDEDFGKLSDDFDFDKVDGFKRVKIDDAEYKRVSLVGLKTTKKKLKVTFDSQDSGTPIVQEVQISKRLPSLEKMGIKDPTSEEYGFLGWYTEPNGKGSSFEENERVWEDCTYYAYWCKEHTSETYEHDVNFHWQICDNCGKQFGKRNHTFGEQTLDRAATCTAKAQYHETCEVCSYRFEFTKGDMLPHQYGNWIKDSDATCTAKAHHHKECANCDARLDEDYGELLPHTVDWIEDYPASCTKRAHHHGECEVCGQTVQEDYGDLLPHEMSDWIIDGENICNRDNDPVPRHKECANCDYTIVDENYVVPHTWNEVTNSCDVCGMDKPYDERDGKIYYGEYPQTKETDNGITATLTQMSGNRPVRGSSGDWTDYGYYIGGRTTEYMWYIDLEYGGARYRGVYFTSYRPYWTTYSSSTGNSNQDDNGYYINTLYWFKWEPIEWRVLERTDGEALLMSNVILDSQQYYRTDSGTRNIDGKTVYPNNYKESDIRAWLNGTFYIWAFDNSNQSIIKATLVDNSASTTGFSSNSYACENTNDKVFLLSYKDVVNTNYGFNSSSSNYDTARRLKTTDYAQSQGAYTSTRSSYRGNGWWWLRSPYDYSSNDARLVCYDGDAAGYINGVNLTYRGVVPAIKIQL